MRLTARQRETIAGYSFLLPNFVGFLAFTSFPVVFSFIIAFFKWDNLRPPEFVRLSNFSDLMLHTPEFWEWCGNTLFLMLGIPLGMLASLGLALLMNRKLKGATFFRTIFFLPTATSGVAILIMWIWIYNPDYGLVNLCIARFGDAINLIASTVAGRDAGISFKGPAWLASRTWAKPAFILMGTWTAAGGPTMILYLAGLSQISPALYEAADIDGANAWQKFRHVTWPMLAPTTFFILIMGVIGGLQGGVQAAYVMTQGGYGTTTIGYAIYNQAFNLLEMGRAAALSWVLFGIVFVVTIVNWKYGGKVVHYE
ncbi:carbohydrate ABC transporter permease [Candidatus Hydrogenedentota bacterium]